MMNKTTSPTRSRGTRIPCGHWPPALVPRFIPPGLHCRMFPIPYGELLAMVISPDQAQWPADDPSNWTDRK